MSTNSSDLSFLTGAAGKDNNDSGAHDYFQPGTHKVQITKLEAGPSQKKPGTKKVVIEGVIVQGGEGTILYRKDEATGKVTKLDVPETLPAPRRGRRQASILQSTHSKFEENLGNFALNAKKTFMAVYLAAEAAGPDDLNSFLADKGLTAADVAKFVARGKENPNNTTAEDIIDVVRMDLPVGLVMTVAVRQHLNMQGALTGVTTWSAGTVQDLALLSDDE